MKVGGPDSKKYETAIEPCEEWKQFVQDTHDKTNPGGVASITRSPSQDITPTLRQVTLCTVTWERTINGQTTRLNYNRGIYAGGCYEGRYPIPGTEFPSEPSKCTENVKCAAPFFINKLGQCEAYCVTGEVWDSDMERCAAPPQEQNCKTQGRSPIDFIDGRKYRSELVLTAGARYPFSLTYFFNNQRNQEKSPVGSRLAVVTSDRYLAATKASVTASEYKVLYTNRGVPIGGTVYLSSQHYGSLDQYWRHNFDEILLIHGSQYVYQSAKGNEIIFSGFGASAAYPHLRLQTLTSDEESFSGYKLTDNKTHEVKKFNGNGLLIKIERSSQDILILKLR